MVSGNSTPSGDRRVPPSQTIVEAIAAAENVDPVDVEPPAYEPLYAVVDLEALDALFDGRERTDLEVAFTYEGYYVVVQADGRVDVAARSPNDPDTLLEE